LGGEGSCKIEEKVYTKRVSTGRGLRQEGGKRGLWERQTIGREGNEGKKNLGRESVVRKNRNLQKERKV